MKKVKKGQQKIRFKKPRKNRRVMAKKNSGFAAKAATKGIFSWVVPRVRLFRSRVLRPVFAFLWRCLCESGTQGGALFDKGRNLISSMEIIPRLFSMTKIGARWTVCNAWPVCNRFSIWTWRQFQALFASSRRSVLKQKIIVSLGGLRQLITSPKSTVRTAIPQLFSLRKNTPQKVAHFFNPRVVRLEEPNKYVLHSLMISLLFVCVAVTAVAVAASVKNSSHHWRSTPESPESNEDDLRPERSDAARTAWLQQPDATLRVDNSVPNSTPPSPPKKTTPKKDKQPAISANYYNPIYVFTQAEAESASAYPLADPPGIVVNLQGLEEPEESAENMVGEDTRVLRVKRRITSAGLRYIIHLKQPIKKIESHKEGNVITINPL